VFSQGNRRDPDSTRMLLGLAAALYMQGDYEHAARHLYEASDRNPNDLTPYLFLGQVQADPIVRSREYRDRLARFAQVAPDGALANYYYAACLWRQRSKDDDPATTKQIFELVDKAIRLDPKLASGYLLLGILYSERKDLPLAISAYRKAIEVSPDPEEAHYRLAKVYELRGETVKVKQELNIYKELLARAAEKTERERQEIQRFVFTLRDGKAGAIPDK
jgi:tetratricopeptide (TPR) repeat protein